MASARTAKADQGETVDQLVWRILAGGTGTVEATYRLNPGLAALGPLLVEGTEVVLPADSKAFNDKPIVQLWD